MNQTQTMLLIPAKLTGLLVVSTLICLLSPLSFAHNQCQEIFNTHTTHPFNENLPLNVHRASSSIRTNRQNQLNQLDPSSQLDHLMSWNVWSPNGQEIELRIFSLSSAEITHLSQVLSALYENNIIDDILPGVVLWRFKDSMIRKMNLGYYKHLLDKLPQSPVYGIALQLHEKIDVIPKNLQTDHTIIAGKKRILNALKRSGLTVQNPEFRMSRSGNILLYNFETIQFGSPGEVD
jgi:hypothetical protein